MNSTINVESTVLITEMLSRPIAFHRIFSKITKDALAGLFLSQAYYWSFRTTLEDEWFYKTGEEWEEETTLTRRQQENARKKLKALGLIEEKKEGVPCKLYFRVDRDKLHELILGYSEQSLTVERFLQIYNSSLVGLSKAGLMRARKLNATSQYVDYREVVKKHGLVCHICGEKIIQGLGKNSTHLSFDYVIPLNEGGEHSLDNIKPCHATCNLAKSDEMPTASSLFKISKLECLDKTNKDAQFKQTIYSTESISEINTETTEPPYSPPPERGDIAGRKKARSKDFVKNAQEGTSNSSNEQIHTQGSNEPLKTQISTNNATFNIELDEATNVALDNESLNKKPQRLATQGREAQNEVIEAEIVEPEIIQDCLSTFNNPGELLVVEQHIQPRANVPQPAQTNQTAFVPLGGKKELKSGRTYEEWEGRVATSRGRTRVGVNPEFVGYVIKRNAHIKYFQELKGSELIRATETWLSKRPEEAGWLWDDFLSGEEVENKTIKQVQEDAKRNEAMDRMSSWIKDMSKEV